MCLLVVLVLASCGGGTSVIGPTPTPAPSATDAAVPTATPKPTEVVVGGSRPVTIHLPPGSGTTPAPLVLAIHGFGWSGAELASYVAVRAEAAVRGIVVAFPDGTRNPDGNRFWNATDACCDFFGSGVDDVGYLTGLIEEISRATPIDPKRVYVVGHSNGGFMSFRMACDRAAVIAAIASLAGATFGDSAKCAPSEPVAVLEIHGTADDAVLLGGGTITFGGTVPQQPYPGTEATMLAWAVYDGCRAGLETIPEMLDLDRGIDGPSGSDEATIGAAQECSPGGAAELWTIPGGAHVLDLSSSFVAKVIDFLLAHPKP